MSQRVRDALRPKIDQMTADYIDAAVEAAFREHLSLSHKPPEVTSLAELKAKEDRLRDLATRLEAHRADIEDLKDQRDQADPYTLTKAGLIRLMKKMGIH